MARFLSIEAGHDISSRLLAYRESGRRQMAAQAATGVVQGLVERAAGRLQPLREHVDGNLVERERDQDAPLVRRERRPDAVADRAEQLALLRLVLRKRPGAREDAPGLVLDGDLAALPGSAPDFHRCLVEGELVGPGGEAAPAAVVVEALQHGEQRIVGRLLRDLVQITAEVRMRGPPPPRLETGCSQEQRVEALDGVVVDDPAGAQVAKPRARFVVEGGPAVLLDRGGSPGGAAPCATR